MFSIGFKWCGFWLYKEWRCTSLPRFRENTDPVAKHFFNTPSIVFQYATVMTIELLHSANSMRQKYRESYWIYTLRTLTPDGLNLELFTNS